MNTPSSFHRSTFSLRAFARRYLPLRFQHFIKKLYYPRLLRHFDESRWPEFAIVKQFVHEGDCVVDAGANIGYISMLLSGRVGEQGCVYSFEPVPDTFDLLAHNVKHLRLSNVRLHNQGLSSSVSEAVMEIPQYASGGENLYESRIVRGGNSGERSVPVQLTTIDTIFGEEDRWPSFIKIDVEGHELQLLEGARKILEKSRPALLIEIADDPVHGPDSGARTFKMLADLQYVAYGVDKTKLMPCNGPCGKVDYLFIQPQYTERISAFLVSSCALCLERS